MRCVTGHQMLVLVGYLMLFPIVFWAGSPTADHWQQARWLLEEKLKTIITDELKFQSVILLEKKASGLLLTLKVWVVWWGRIWWYSQGSSRKGDGSQTSDRRQWNKGQGWHECRFITACPNPTAPFPGRWNNTACLLITREALCCSHKSSKTCLTRVGEDQPTHDKLLSFILHAVYHQKCYVCSEQNVQVW